MKAIQNKARASTFAPTLTACLVALALPMAARAATPSADVAAPTAPTTDTYTVAANDPPPAVPDGMTGKQFFRQGDKRWELTVAPYVYHWSEDPAHKRVGLLGLERHNVEDHSLWGGALFTNSFGQNSAYGYYGHEWNDIFGVHNLYLKASAGVIYGYVGQYKNKVPFNYKGFAPVIIPGVGYRFTEQDAAQIAVLGTAGLIFMYSRSF